MKKTDGDFLRDHPEFVALLEEGAGIAWFNIKAEKEQTAYSRAVVDMMLAVARAYPQYLFNLWLCVTMPQC
jgi:hypothetical protein